jgi:hypothetical protein
MTIGNVDREFELEFTPNVPLEQTSFIMIAIIKMSDAHHRIGLLADVCGTIREPYDPSDLPLLRVNRIRIIRHVDMSAYFEEPPPQRQSPNR